MDLTNHIYQSQQQHATKYPKHSPDLPIVAFDFDGVIARDTWPSPRIGLLQQDAVDAIRHYANENCEIIVYTARPDEHLPLIREWLDRNGIGYLIYEVTNKKPRACLYFDDRAVRWPL